MVKTLLVTVGTTLFDALIQAVDSDDFLTTARKHGFTSIVLQIGKGQIPTRHSWKCRDDGKSPQPTSDFNLVYFRFCNDLTKEISQATAVVGHAGSGTILECLRANKPLLVIPNETLMDNHQLEVAETLHNSHHLIRGSVSRLPTSLEELVAKAPGLMQLPAKNMNPFLDLIDEELHKAGVKQ